MREANAEREGKYLAPSCTPDFPCSCPFLAVVSESNHYPLPCAAVKLKKVNVLPVCSALIILCLFKPRVQSAFNWRNSLENIARNTAAIRISRQKNWRFSFPHFLINVKLWREQCTHRAFDCCEFVPRSDSSISG